MKKIILLLVFAIISGVLFSQTDSLKLYDVAVLPVIKHESNVPRNNSSPADSLNDTIKVQLPFKINFPARADKIYIKFGTDKDLSDIKNVVLNVTSQTNIYHIQCEGFTSKIFGRSTIYFCDFRKKVNEKIKWITIYAVDKDGIYTKKYYLKYNN